MISLQIKNILLLSFLFVVACIPRPTDPVSMGILCDIPTPECKNSTLLLRPSVGRNQFDYTIENKGKTPTDVNVVVVTPEIETLDLQNLDPERIIASRIHRQILPGESEGNRLTPKLLGTRDSFRIFTLCTNREANTPCNIRVDYVFSSVPVECFDDTECNSGWLCDVNIGHCTECLSSTDCNTDQTCDTIRGRCTPEDTTPSTCSTSSHPASLLLSLLGLFFFTRRRKRKPKAVTSLTISRLLFIFSFLLFSIVLSTNINASPPRTGISLGTGTRYLLGELGNDTKRGIGIYLAQELRWRHFGMNIELGTSFFQTTQTPPPFSRGLMTYTAAIGPQLFWALGRHELTGGVDIRRIGFLNNSLVRVTGTKTNFTAIGANIGYRFHFEKIDLRLSTVFAPFLDLPGSTLNFNIGIGFNTFR